MKINKILIITYDWPPRNSIATHRPYSWAKYFSKAGFHVTVLTAEKQFYDSPLDLNLPVLENVNVITVQNPLSTKYTLISNFKKKSKLFDLLTKLNSTIKYYLGINFDPRIWWSNLILNNKIKLNTDFDIVISTYGPQSSHFIAAYLKSINQDIKWVADYRDLWSISHLSYLPLWKKKQLMKIEYNLVAENASLVTTVSEELSKDLNTFLKTNSKVILNGFDIENQLLFDNLTKKKYLNKSTINIVYTGMIYIGRRDPSPLFKAISEIDNNKINIEFYGSSSDVVFQLFKGNLPNYIKCKGHVNRDQSLLIQRNADFVLLLESSNDDAKGVLTGKVFEYISSGTPILSIGSKDDSAIGKLLKYTGCGKCFENNIEEIKKELYTYIVNQNPDWYKPDYNRILEFSRENQANRFIDLIQNL